MTYKKSLENGVLTFSFEGWLDTTSSPEIDGDIEKLPEGVNELIFDFDKLEYISSAGLRRIVMAAHSAKETGAQFRIINAGTTVLNVLKMTNFTNKYSVEAKEV